MKMNKMDLIQMNKIIFLIFFTITTLFSLENINPTSTFKASGGVTDMVKSNNKLYIATQSSCVDIFNLKTKQLINKIKIPQIEDFMGDIVDAKIYSVDVFKKSIILVAQHSSGFRELYIFKNNELKKLISAEDKFYITKARFLDNERLVFATLGNTFYYYDYKHKKILSSLEVKAPEAEFNSTFSDFVLNENKTLAAVADEGGDLKIIDIKKQKVIKVLAGKNLDKVFKVDFKNNIIITAGQDGRAVVYNLKNNSSYTLREKHWFLIYTAALSPKEKFGAYSIDQDNNIMVFNTNTKEKLYLLKKNLMNPTIILFINKKEILVATDSNKLNYYRLK